MEFSKGIRNIISFITLVLTLILLICSATAETIAPGIQRTSMEIIEELALYYGTYGKEADEKTAALLNELSAVDPAAGAKWQSIIKLWEKVNTDIEIYGIESVFPNWNPEAPALKALIEYVEDVTDESSPNFIPPVDRIATFDMDGTLIGELFPTYLETILLTNRILGDDTYQPDEEMLEFGRMTRDHAPDKSFPADFDYEFSYHQAKAFAGMTLNEYADFITRVLVRDADGFEGMTYASAYYIPMVELVEYLQDYDFKCFVVSGSDRFIVRTMMEGVADIPYENIIGSDTALTAKNQGDTDGINYVYTSDDTLVRTDKLIIKDLKTNKVLQIAQEIGRQPVLSFGNTSGDVSMHNYAILNNRYRSAAFMVIADDSVRDYGNPAIHDELTEKWQGMGYYVISMRDDWKTIYGEDVKKTGTFHWLEDFADETPSADTDYLQNK